MSNEAVIVDSMSWVPVSNEKKRVTVGGAPTLATVEQWPHFNEEPLPFFGSVIFDGKTAELFLGSTDNQSWLLEGGSNCVSVDGEFPEWVTVKPVGEPVLYTDAGVWGTDDTLPEPEWLQGDETPDGFEFVAQIPSQIDGGEVINIGDGYGTAYVFVQPGTNNARMVWQS